MIEKIWGSLRYAEAHSVESEIIAWTYWNCPGNKIKDIREKFDSWRIEDFIETLESVDSLSTFEGEIIRQTEFAVREWTARIPFYEGVNLSYLPEFFWFEVSKRQNKKKKFF